MDHISQSRAYLTTLADNPVANAASKGGLSHLDYLGKQWMPVPMWQSWSEWGRIAASAILKVPVEDVIPTTNHLESFNAILKRKYIRSWLHSGHRLRFDVLIMLLVTRILPDIFKRRISRRNHRLWVDERFKEAAGGVDLCGLQEKLRTERKELEKKARVVCWWEEGNGARRTLGEALVPSISRHVYKGIDSDSYIAQCASSRDPTQTYDVALHRSGRGSCTCLDFNERGGACKHLWALRRCIEYYILVLHIDTPFVYPTTLHAAQQLVRGDPKPQLGVDEPSGPDVVVDWKAIQTFGQDNIGFGGDLDHGELEDEDKDEAANPEHIIFPMVCFFSPFELVN